MPSTASRTSPSAAAGLADPVVSSDQDALILVNELDEEIGSASKAACHDGDGQRHRAFSLFVFNAAGDLLLQQRAPGKRLWPGFWSNSCCSHPRLGESMTVATERRLAEELGLRTNLEFLYRFEYIARFEDAGTEHELCAVYAGRVHEDPKPNGNEIADWRWVPAAQVSSELAQAPERFTPWFQLEWQHICQEFRHWAQTPDA